MSTTGAQCPYWWRRLLLVDFNEIGVDGPLDVYSLDAAPVGERVLTHDGGGERCEGIVAALEPDGLTRITLDWSTWGHSPGTEGKRQSDA